MADGITKISPMLTMKNGTILTNSWRVAGGVTREIKYGIQKTNSTTRINFGAVTRRFSRLERTNVNKIAKKPKVNTI
jgi:hypothetical protein